MSAASSATTRRSATTDSIARDELTERLVATMDLYAHDERLDVDAAVGRLIALSEGDRAALDLAHKKAVSRLDEQRGDPVRRRALEIARVAIERAGGC